jgi:hypothetical protein
MNVDVKKLLIVILLVTLHLLRKYFETTSVEFKEIEDVFHEVFDQEEE